MTEREESRKLKGLVQIDYAYLVGERNGGKAGRGSENKQALLIAVETDTDLEHPRCAVIEPVRTFEKLRQIGVYDPVHFFLSNRHRQGVQRIVLSTPRSEGTRALEGGLK